MRTFALLMALAVCLGGCASGTPDDHAAAPEVSASSGGGALETADMQAEQRRLILQR